MIPCIHSVEQCYPTSSWDAQIWIQTPLKRQLQITWGSPVPVPHVLFYCLIPTTEVSFQHSSPQFLPPERSALPGTSRSFLRGFTSRAGPRTWLTCPMSSCPIPRGMDNIQPREADAFSPRTDLIWSPALQTPESSSSSHYAEMFSQTQFQVVTEIQVSFLLWDYSWDEWSIFYLKTMYLFLCGTPESWDSLRRGNWKRELTMNW